jgi:hypothetical protein
MQSLTGKQAKFCLYLFQGFSQHDSWLKAGYSSTMLPATIDHNACLLAKKDKIVARMKELSQAASSPAIMDVKSRKLRLTQIATENVLSVTGAPVRRDNIAAIDLLNKMDHVYVEQPQGNTTNNTWNIVVVDKETEQLLKLVNKRTQDVTKLSQVVSQPLIEG